MLLATQILDGSQFHDGRGPNMTVAVAQFQQKGSEFKAKAKPKKNKKKVAASLEKKEAKLLGWGGFDDQLKPTQV